MLVPLFQTSLADHFSSVGLEKEIEIVYDLAQRVLQYESVLVDASDICGEIDRYIIPNEIAIFG